MNQNELLKYRVELLSRFIVSLDSIESFVASYYLVLDSDYQHIVWG